MKDATEGEEEEDESTDESEKKRLVQHSTATLSRRRPKNGARGKRSGPVQPQQGPSASVVTTGAPLRKTDSFEGHEEAVRTLVEAVHETRKKEAAMKKQKN